MQYTCILEMCQEHNELNIFRLKDILYSAKDMQYESVHGEKVSMEETILSMNKELEDPEGKVDLSGYLTLTDGILHLIRHSPIEGQREPSLHPAKDMQYENHHSKKVFMEEAILSIKEALQAPKGSVDLSGCLALTEDILNLIRHSSKVDPGLVKVKYMGREGGGKVHRNK